MNQPLISGVPVRICWTQYAPVFFFAGDAQVTEMTSSGSALDSVHCDILYLCCHFFINSVKLIAVFLVSPRECMESLGETHIYCLPLITG